jgi:hypothetical protein
MILKASPSSGAPGKSVSRFFMFPFIIEILIANDLASHLIIPRIICPLAALLEPVPVLETI